MKRLFVSLALLMLLFLTMFPLTVVALSSDEGASTTWGNIKTGTGVNLDSAKLAPSVGSYTKLIVPFYRQVPPGDWDNTMNCGQASVLTCAGYLLLKRVCYAYPAPLITKENEWLAKNTNAEDGPKYLNPNGYVTGGDRIVNLESLARNYWGLKNSVAIKGNSCGTINALCDELTAGRPVIVEVITNMAPVAVEDGDTYHFMVLIGMKIGADDANSYVWVNDVGRPNGPGNKYTLDKFKLSWATSNNHCVFIRP